jgi:hypothetical protein
MFKRDSAPSGFNAAVVKFTWYFADHTVTAW